MSEDLNFLSRRAGFNTALRHFRVVTRYVEEVQGGANLADLIDLSLEEGEINRTQVKAIVNALLVDKFGYQVRSYNLPRTIEDMKSICDVVADWGRIQLCVAYLHPQAGLFVLNPKRREAWEQAMPLLKDELIVIYGGAAEPDVPAATIGKAVGDLVKLFEGRRVTTKADYKSDRPMSAPPPPRPAERPAPQTAGSPTAAPTGKVRMTPRYSVVVTNELFHNGNVEAWKKIVESYRGKYPTLDVMIWYENERINDINALFKWGKVKHGNPIMVSVVGDDIKDVSKLQRYLFEGASPRFEVFLRGAVDSVLDLF